MSLSIHQILTRQCGLSPAAPAILAPGRGPLDYRSLVRQVDSIGSRLTSAGIGRGDRVAIVLPNGPEAAVATLAVSCCAVSAPLNPSYRESEFEFLLSDLGARALLIGEALQSPARAMATRRGIAILEVASTPVDAADSFRLEGTTTGAARVAGPDDVALVLHTSGTTSRPKLVPLTHRNLCTSAFNTMRTLELTAHDRCLNVMPMFHIHGLIAALLATLSAGGSVVCSPGFQAELFFQWLDEFSPTWYTAVPTVHQAILDRVEGCRDVVARRPLRVIRSSSAALPPQLMIRLEHAFRAPVIEAYGMTEAAHQIASNPMPPRPRKPGSVGIAAGPEIGIVDEAGQSLPAGQPGEIVIRGETVTAGYEGDPAVNQAAFTNGWFHTGDLGALDEDGYLRITGRIKEVINRGGEKVMPREVDEALLEHPDVAQALAFAVPHPTLGEDLAAAVVLRDRTVRTTAEQLREFAFSRLADFKVPSQLVVVDEIPRGPSGKLQRIGLAEKLASALRPDFVPPTKVTEQTLAEIWRRVLGRERVGIHDNFFSLGGDSLAAAAVMTEIVARIGTDLEPTVLFRAPTVEQLSRLIQRGATECGSYVLPMRAGGSRPPLFLVPGHGGDVFTYVNVVRHLDPEQPVYVFRFPEKALRDDTVANGMVEDMAALYVGEMQRLQPRGPYRIAGFCYGGDVAYEMAQQLHAGGHRTEFLGLIYVYLPGGVHAAGLRSRLAHHLRGFMQGSLGQKAAYARQLVVRALARTTRRVAPPLARDTLPVVAEGPYRFLYYPGAITLFQPTDDRIDGMTYESHMGWAGLAADIRTLQIPGDRHTIFSEPHARALAAALQHGLESAESR